MFATTPQFLPQHHQQRQQVIQISSAAEACGQERLAEMDRQVQTHESRVVAAPAPLGNRDARAGRVDVDGSFQGGTVRPLPDAVILRADTGYR